MAAPSLTYTLTNGATADASQVMQNFNDLLNGITDGTKDLSISALTLAGTLTANGHVNIGNSSSDDLSITASLASTIPIKTTRTYNIGSADLGLATIYLGGNSTHTVALSAAGSGLSGDVTFTLPVSNGTSGGYLKTNGSGATSWQDFPRSYLHLQGSNGYGNASNAMIRSFSGVVESVGTAVTHTDSGTSGSVFTINETGLYGITYTDNFNAAAWVGISLNADDGGYLATAIFNIPKANTRAQGQALAAITTAGASYADTASVQYYLIAGDTIRAHTDGVPFGTQTNCCQFRIVKLSD